MKSNALVSLLLLLPIFHAVAEPVAPGAGRVPSEMNQAEPRPIPPELPTLSSAEERQRQALLAQLRSVDVNAVQDALVALTRNGIVFMRNASAILAGVQERSGGVAAEKLDRITHDLAIRLRSVPEGEHKAAIVEQFFSFRESSVIDGSLRFQFDDALYQGIYMASDAMPVIPEYGAWKLVNAFIQDLETTNELVRRAAASNLARIGAFDKNKRGYIIAVLRDRLSTEESAWAIEHIKRAAKPADEGIRAREYEGLQRLTSKELVEIIHMESVPLQYPRFLLMGTPEKVKANFPDLLELIADESVFMGWDAPLKLAIPAATNAPQEDKARVEQTLRFFEAAIENARADGRTPRWALEGVYRSVVLIGGTPEKRVLGHGGETAVTILIRALQDDSYRMAAEAAKWLRQISELDAGATERIENAFAARLAELPASDVPDSDFANLRDTLAKGAGAEQASVSPRGGGR